MRCKSFTTVCACSPLIWIHTLQLIVPIHICSIKDINLKFLFSWIDSNSFTLWPDELLLHHLNGLYNILNAPNLDCPCHTLNPLGLHCTSWKPKADPRNAFPRKVDFSFTKKCRITTFFITRTHSIMKSTFYVSLMSSFERNTRVLFSTVNNTLLPSNSHPPHLGSAA